MRHPLAISIAAVLSLSSVTALADGRFSVSDKPYEISSDAKAMKLNPSDFAERLGPLMSTIKQANDNADQARKEYLATRDRLKSLEVDIKALYAQRKALKQTQQDLESLDSATLEELRALKRDNEQFRAELDRANTDRHRYEEELMQLKVTNEAAQKRLKESLVAHRTTQARIDATQGLIAQTDAQLRALYQDSTERINQLAKQTSEMSRSFEQLAQSQRAMGIKIDDVLQTALATQAQLAEVKQDNRNQDNRLNSHDVRLSKLEKSTGTSKGLRSFPFPRYVRNTASTPRLGDNVTLFGHFYPVGTVKLAHNPLFPGLDRVSISMPQQRPSCCKNGEAAIRTGVSSYPRSFLPFSDVYGPPAHSVELEPIEIDGYAGEYGIGVMSDYGTTYISAVINLELEPGLFYVIRLGYSPKNPALFSMRNVAKDVHRFLDAISIKRR